MTADLTISNVGLITYFRASNVWVSPATAIATLAAHGIDASVPDLSKRGVSRASFAASHWRGPELRADVVERKDDEITIGLLRRTKVSDSEVGWVQFDAVTWSEAAGWTGATSDEGREFYGYGTKWQTHLDYHWCRDTVFSVLKRIGIPMGGGGICYVHGDMMEAFDQLQGWIGEIAGAKLYAIKIDAADPGSLEAIGGSAKDHALTQVADVTDRLNEWRERARGKTSTLETLLTELSEIRGRAIALSTALRFSTEEVDAAVEAAEVELRSTLEIATKAEAKPARKARASKDAEIVAKDAEIAAKDAALAALQAELAALRAAAPPVAPALAPVEPAVETTVECEDGTAALLARIPGVDVLERSTARELRTLAKEVGVKGYGRMSEADLISGILARREDLAQA